MKKNAKKLIVPLLAAILVALVLIPTHVARAELDCSFNPLTWPTCLLFAGTYVMGLALGMLMMLAAWLLEIILQASTGIANLPIVGRGFGISLALSNLLFVFGIIVVAIATIVRYETYGLKQILWKLVVVAVLVNFSMFIASGVIGFADGVTTYFLHGVSPNGGVSQFALNFAGTLAPQAANNISQADYQKQLEDSAGSNGGILAYTIVTILKYYFLLMTIVVVFFAVVMLLIRYVALALLLVLMPIAWACWPFPDLQSNFSKWWSNFLRYTFFAPIFMFFMYLAISSFQDPKVINQGVVGHVIGQPGSVSAAVSGALLDLLKTVGQQVIAMAFMVGGIFVANSMSIYGASAVLNSAKGAGKAFGSFTGRAARGGTTALARRTGLTQAAVERSKRGGLFGRAAGLLGQGLAGLEEARPSAVKKHEDELKGRSKIYKQAALANASGARRIALMKSLAAEGDLDLKQSHNAETEKLFGTYQQSKEYGELETASGTSKDMYETGKQIEKIKQKVASGGATDDDRKKFNELGAKMVNYRKDFAQKRTAEDLRKTNVDKLYGGKEAFGESAEFIKSMSEQFSAGIASSMPEIGLALSKKMKGPAINNFIPTHEKALREEITRIGRPDAQGKVAPLNAKEEQSLSRLTSALNNLTKSIGHNVMFGGIEEGGAAAVGSAPPKPPTAPPLQGIPGV